MSQQKRKFRYIRINGKVIQDPFDDEDMRKLFISFAEKVLGLKFISGTKYGIDLVCVDDPSWGAEGENGSFQGDRWAGNQQDIFNRPHEDFFNIETSENTFLPNNYDFLVNNENFKN